MESIIKNIRVITITIAMLLLITLLIYFKEDTTDKTVPKRAILVYLNEDWHDVNG